VHHVCRPMMWQLVRHRLAVRLSKNARNNPKSAHTP
jgi:hypothetical protein